MSGVLILAVLILGGIELVSAQIPSVCANNADLQSGRCCPNNCGGSARGECVDVSIMCKTDYETVGVPKNDERLNWPSNIFNFTCKCNGNYGGYDCLECKFGYEGSDCSEKQKRKRGSITSDSFIWEDYHNQLMIAKDRNQTRYKVFTGGDHKDEMNYQNVSLYNLFVWMHHYATYTLEDEYPKDGSGNFLLHWFT